MGRPGLTRGGHLFRFEPVLRWGPFLAVSWGWRVFDRREPDEALLGYAGGGTLYLVETDDGWKVVGGPSWITLRRCSDDREGLGDGVLVGGPLHVGHETPGPGLVT